MRRARNSGPHDTKVARVGMFLATLMEYFGIASRPVFGLSRTEGGRAASCSTRLAPPQRCYAIPRRQASPASNASMLTCSGMGIGIRGRERDGGCECECACGAAVRHTQSQASSPGLNYEDPHATERKGKLCSWYACLQLVCLPATSLPSITLSGFPTSSLVVLRRLRLLIGRRC